MGWLGKSDRAAPYHVCGVDLVTDRQVDRARFSPSNFTCLGLKVYVSTLSDRATRHTS